MTKRQATELINTKLSHYFGVLPNNATYEHYYKAIAMIVKDIMTVDYNKFMEQASKSGAKNVYYLCMEFLMGRSLKNNLYNLGLSQVMEDALADVGIKIESIYNQEPDAGLGNGGLGRLAACYLDGLASQGYPSMGYSIRYEYGIFKQKIIDGWQTELPDFWLPGGEVWLTPREEEAVTIKFEGNVREWWDGSYHHVEHENFKPVVAIPYDMMVSGKDGKAISKLRLWAAKAPGFDMSLFNQGDYLRSVEQNAMAEVISKVLYPADNHQEGKSLRLRQQYFLVSSSVQDIITRHLSQFGTLDNLPDKIAIQLNDTHPALAIPELMRILMDECGYGWDQAWDIVTRTVSYTNHTVMKEALECWSEDMFKRLLPRIAQITKEIDNRFRYSVWEATHDADKVERMAIISDNVVRMANLCVAGSHAVNGVSRLHSEILKDTVFHDFYTVTPEKFKNVTNGIAHRRWLCQANPELTEYLTKLIGGDFATDASALTKLNAYAGDPKVLDRLGEIKLNNKKKFAEYVLKNNGVEINPESIFDVQVKRLHEYKRQHLNALHILAQYKYVKEHPEADFVPHTYLFAAKAASGYYMAKKIINLICEIANMINNDKSINDKIKVVFLENYSVTLAEMLMPAADISEQISLAGTEASGTGNMKLMMNGAVTLGTLDGANVEIHEAVGDDNILIFGMTTSEVEDSRKMGYNPQSYYYNNPVLKDVIDMINSGINGKSFSEIGSQLISSDPYMVMADFADYCRVHDLAMDIYRDRRRWNRMSLCNIANSGRFAADRAVNDYARDIWHTPSVFSK